MIRRKPLKAKRGLQTRSPLTAKSSLKAKKGLTATKSLRPRSKRMEEIYKKRRPLVEDLLKRYPNCQIVWDARCSGASVDVHEVKARSVGGKIVDDDLSNYLTACRHCHMMATDHPKEAHDRGFIKWSWEQ